MNGTRQAGTPGQALVELVGADAGVAVRVEHLEGALDASGFMHIREKRSIMVRNLRNMLGRAELTEKEVRILRGVVASLAAHKPDDKN